MLILKLRTKTSERSAIRAAVLALRRGDIVAFATETVYGIGCDPRNKKAVSRLFRIKGRASSKAIQLIAGSLAQVKKLSTISTPNRRVIGTYWPGPLTLLLPLKQGVKLAPPVCPKGVIGIRVTSNAFLAKLALAFGRPIATTSANRSGEAPARSGRGTVHAFSGGRHPDLVIDSGSISRRKPTTVARVDADGSIHVLRQGSCRIKKPV